MAARFNMLTSKHVPRGAADSAAPLSFHLTSWVFLQVREASSSQAMGDPPILFNRPSDRGGGPSGPECSGSATLVHELPVHAQLSVHK